MAEPLEYDDDYIAGMFWSYAQMASRAAALKAERRCAEDAGSTWALHVAAVEDLERLQSLVEDPDRPEYIKDDVCTLDLAWYVVVRRAMADHGNWTGRGMWWRSPSLDEMNTPNFIRAFVTGALRVIAKAVPEDGSNVNETDGQQQAAPTER